MCFESFVCGPDKFILSVKFSFSINGKKSFLCVVLFSFVEFYFLSNVSMKLV